MPVPGGPTSRMPLGIFAREAVELLGLLEELDDLLQVFFDPLQAGDLVEGDALAVGVVLAGGAADDAPDKPAAEHLVAAASHRCPPEEEHHEQPHRHDGEDEVADVGRVFGLDHNTLVLDRGEPLFTELGGEAAEELRLLVLALLGLSLPMSCVRPRTVTSATLPDSSSSWNLLKGIVSRESQGPARSATAETTSSPTAIQWTGVQRQGVCGRGGEGSSGVLGGSGIARGGASCGSRVAGVGAKRGPGFAVQEWRGPGDSPFGLDLSHPSAERKCWRAARVLLRAA